MTVCMLRVMKDPVNQGNSVAHSCLIIGFENGAHYIHVHYINVQYFLHSGVKAAL